MLKRDNDHQLFACPDFKALDIEARRTYVMQNRVCFNCLSNGHQVRQCRTRFRCKTCQKSHHTLLHQELQQAMDSVGESSNSTGQSVSSVNPEQSSSKGQGKDVSAVTSFTLNHRGRQTALLPTALVLVKDSSGQYHHCRVLLDSAWTASFIRPTSQHSGHTLIASYGLGGNLKNLMKFAIYG